MNRLKLLLVALVVSVLISCDPMTEFYKIVVNNSDYDLWVYMSGDSVNSDSTRYYSDSFSIKKHTEVEVRHFGDMGTISRFPDCNGFSGFPNDSFFCKIDGNDTLKLNIDMNDMFYWNYNAVEENRVGGGTVTCKLIVDNDDIE
jgi:hypothetical protein